MIRPEVIISKSSKDIHFKNIKEEDMIISINSRVRVIRDPFFGKVGKVVSLPKELMRMESETIVRVAEIEFNNGDKKIIPRANLEVILSD